MHEDLPARIRLQVQLSRAVTMVLRRLGLRDRFVRARLSVGRARRRLFERAGSARYSRPALHGMDRKLDEIIDCDGGFFVEAGGHDGYTQSNTYYLERFRGWNGVLVEPMPELAAQARLNRPRSQVFRCALVAPEDQATEVEMDFGDLFSNVSGRSGMADSWAANGLVLGWRDPRRELVPARTLADVLLEAGAEGIDLLSLDVEGYEEPVLRGLDLDTFAPRWILVEMHELDQGREQLAPVLGGRYVEHAQLSPLDVLYRRRDVAATGSSAAGAAAGGEERPAVTG